MLCDDIFSRVDEPEGSDTNLLWKTKTNTDREKKKKKQTITHREKREKMIYVVHHKGLRPRAAVRRKLMFVQDVTREMGERPEE